MSKLRDAALRLVGKGIAVFPLRPKTKEPFGDDKRYRTVGGYKAATRDPALVEFWWDRHPDANIGAPTGSINGFWVLDLDNEDDEAWLRQPEAAHPDEPLPRTVEVITGKGRQLYFRYPFGRDIRNVQDRDDMPDVRGNGGYVVVPPSIHPSGRLYTWSVDSANEIAAAPEWLVDAVIKKSAAAKTTTPERWRTFIDERHDGSHRGSAIASLAGLLLRKYVDHLLALSIARMFNTLQCDPPLSDSEVVRIVGNIKRNEDERRAERDAS